METGPGKDQTGGGGGSLLEKGADEVLDHTFKGWLSRTDESQKAALVGLAFALALGPLGQGLAAAFGVLFDEASIPSTQQLEATWWLVVITLPVALPVFVCVAFWGRWSQGAIAAVVIACVIWAVGQQDTVNTQRGNLYCYAELNGLEASYESKCRKFDQYGFLSDAQRIQGPPQARAGLLTGLAFAYTADARGALMAVCGVIAAICLGYLVRRQME